MANTDGKITLGVHIDTEGTQKSAKDMANDIENSFKRVGKSIASAFKDGLSATRQNNKRIKELKSLLAETEKILASQKQRYAELLTTMTPTSAEAVELARKIAESEREAKNLGTAINDLRSKPTIIKKIGAAFKGIGTVMKSVGKGIANFAKRIGQAAARVFVFRVLYSILTKIKEAFGEILSQDARIAQDWEETKVMLQNAIEPIVNVLLPVVQTLTTLLKNFATNLAEAMSLLGATSSAEKNYAKMAKSSEEMAENSKKQLASFDDIEILSSGQEKQPDVVEPSTDAVKVTTAELEEQTASFTSVIMAAVNNIVEQLPKAFDYILSMVKGLLLGIIDTLDELLPNVVSALISMVASLVKELPSVIRPLLVALPSIIADILWTVTNGTPILIDAIAALVAGVIEALPDILVSLVDALPTIVASVMLAIMNLAPTLINAVLQLILSLVKALPSLALNIAAAIPSALSGVFKAMEQWFKTNVLPFFTLDYWKNLAKTAGNGLIEGFENAVNSIINLFEKMIQFVIDGLNLFLKGVDKVISAVGEVFGSDWGVATVPDVSLPRVSVPRLAKGAVIPANREFLAVLGDQKHGTNIETPLATMIEAFQAALDSRESAQPTKEEHYYLNESELMRVVYKLSKGGERLNGKSLVGV